LQGKALQVRRKKQVNKYPTAFRKMALERLKSCRNATELAAELGIHRTQLYKWRDQMEPIEDGAGLAANSRERLIASTGPGNASIDVAAAGDHGIPVVHTGYRSDPTNRLCISMNRFARLSRFILNNYPKITPKESQALQPVATFSSSVILALFR
jgi:transposase